MNTSIIHFHHKKPITATGNNDGIFRINSLRISLTNKCNYECFFCHNEGESKEGHRGLSNFPQALSNIVQAGLELGIRKITITGGEPFLRKDIVQVINKISELSNEILIGITSNGFLLTKDKIDKIGGKIRKMNLNFQSANESVFEDITGVNGLRKITAIIPLLQEAGIHVTLNSVLTSKNFNEIDYILRYAQIHGCDVKILELVREFSQEGRPLVESFNEEMQRLSLQYGGGQLFRISPSEVIFYYDTIKGKRKLRFISSYCNTFDGNACSKHGEVRVSDRLELKHCIMPNSSGINVYKQASSGDIEFIKRGLLKINSLLGVCP